MKLSKIQAGVYEIIKDGQGIGRIADGRKARLYDTAGLHWRINFYKDRDDKLDGKRFRTLKQAKQKLGL